MRLFTADARPGFPYWWEYGAPLPDLPDAPPPKTDVAIIGAGFTGLSAALICAEAGVETLVIEAGVPGEGASSRNGGMMGAHPRLGYDAMCRRFGVETAQALFREAPEALRFTRGLVEREGIDCDLQHTGRIQLAWTRAHFEAQKRMVGQVAEFADVGMEIVERDALSAEISTGQYFGAIRFPAHCAVHPRKFHDGLMAAALRRNSVTVVANCAARRIRRVSGGYEIDTARGTVRAEKVILATNGYTQHLNWIKRRVFPLPSYIVATEALDPARLARLAPAGRMMVETRARHSYFRLSPDGTRLLFGGRAAITPIGPERAAARQRETMLSVWPELQDVRLSHSWSGNTGFTFAQMPHVGSHDGMHHAVGYSGGGVALAPYLGAKAAYQALGDPRGETAYARTSLSARPYHFGGAPWFLMLADLWYRHRVDPAENRAAARDHDAS